MAEGGETVRSLMTTTLTPVLAVPLCADHDTQMTNGIVSLVTHFFAPKFAKTQRVLMQTTTCRG